MAKEKVKRKAAKANEKAPARKMVAQNKKARHDYHIEDTYEAGLVLTGTEVKSLRAGRASLVDGFAEIHEGEAWLHGVHIPEYAQGTWTNHPARRKRKLLLNRAEIDKIERRVNEKGLTIVPTRIYFKDGRAKVELALARGKRAYDKRQALAERLQVVFPARGLVLDLREDRACYPLVGEMLLEQRDRIAPPPPGEHLRIEGPPRLRFRAAPLPCAGQPAARRAGGAGRDRLRGPASERPRGAAGRPRVRRCGPAG